MTGMNWRHVIRTGLLMSLIVLLVSIIGMVETFDERDLVVGYLTLGQLLLFAPAPRRLPHRGPRSPDAALCRRSLRPGRRSGGRSPHPARPAGIGLARHPNLFSNISPALLDIPEQRTRGDDHQDWPATVGMGLLGLIGAAIHLVPGAFAGPPAHGPPDHQRPSLCFSDVPLQHRPNELLDRSIVRILLPAPPGLTPAAAVGAFVISLPPRLLVGLFQPDRPNCRQPRSLRPGRPVTAASPLWPCWCC